jgi:type III restriction enzyme
MTAIPDPFNPVGSTRHVRFNTSKTLRWETSPARCHMNWIILDSEWEAEFCRVAEAHPRVRAYVKNHSLGFEVPYLYGSETRHYRPDFIVRIDDGHGPEDLLNLVVEVKGYRREDAKEKKSTMDTYWVPGVNHLGTWSLGLCRVHRGLRDGVRFQGQGRGRVQQDDRVCRQTIRSHRRRRCLIRPKRI